jgi:hypothetical protein
MGYENEKDNNIDSATCAQRGNVRDGRYFFGYYSPYEDNKNIINMLKDFVSISEHLLHIHHNADKLMFLLKDAKTLQEDLNTKISHLGSTSESAMKYILRGIL